MVAGISVALEPETSQNVTGTYAARQHGCEQCHVAVSDRRTWSNRVVAQQLVQLLSELPTWLLVEAWVARCAGLVRDLATR